MHLGFESTARRTERLLRCTEPKAEGTNTGHEDGEAMASVGVRLTAQLGTARPEK